MSVFGNWWALRFALFSKAFKAWAITVGDCVSQLAGRFIPVYVNGWRCWTQSANESVSGAAKRWALEGRFLRVEKVIDRVFGEGHCYKAYQQDYLRAIGYKQAFERVGLNTGAISEVQR